jgi:biopolymer transport protein ExbB
MSLVLEFFHGGGFMMYPLFICSIALIAIVIERAITIRRATVDGDTLLDAIREAYGGSPAGRSPDAAIAAIENVRAPLARIFVRGLRNSRRDADSIEMAMEQEAANETPVFEAYLPVLRTIVNISPLLGLLGTIAGMIASFRAAAQVGLSNPTQILGGISEALISTATGISIAVLGFIFYNYFSTLARKAIEDIEFYGAELVNFLTERVD